MKIGNRKLIVVIMLLLTINIYAVTLEQRLIDKSMQKEAIKEITSGVRARKSKLTQTEQDEEKNKKIEYLKKVINEEDQYEVQIWDYTSEEMLKFGEKGIEELKEIVKENQKGARAAGKTMLRAGVK